MSDANDSELRLKFGGRLIEQLGAQMYPSATATVAELISNAWDADARNVWVTMPYDEWSSGEITVVDDGLGMSFEDARDSYLIVGHNRRKSRGQRTARERLVHGRKGIGKLAAFGTATVLEVLTRREGHEDVTFRLDYHRIRSQDPDQPYLVEQSQDASPLVNPLTGDQLKHGTRIRLTGLRLKRRLDRDRFAKSMSRRFALDDHEMTVHINEDPLRRFDVDLQFRFPPDRIPSGTEVDASGWAVETLSNGQSVRWWIGFTDKPIREDGQQGISVIVRGRLAQRPFKFERGGGATGQLGQEYLVGEVEADWIDDENQSDDDDHDYIQSNRDQLQLEDDDLAPFVEWGQRRLRWALATRDELKREHSLDRIQRNEALEDLLADRPKRERSALGRVAEAISRLPEAADEQVVRVMEAVINARDEGTAESVLSDLSMAVGDPNEVLRLTRELAELDGRSALTFLNARRDALGHLRLIPSDSGLPQFLLELFRVSPGLLDPGWERLEPSELLQLEEGVELIVLRSDSFSPAISVLVCAEGATEASVGAATSLVGEDSPEAEIVVLRTGPKARSGGEVTWTDLVDQARTSYEQWAAQVKKRLSNSSGGRS